VDNAIEILKKNELFTKVQYVTTKNSYLKSFRNVKVVIFAGIKILGWSSNTVIK